MDLNNVIFANEADLRFNKINVLHQLQDIKAGAGNEIILIESTTINNDSNLHHQILNQNIANVEIINQFQTNQNDDDANKIQIFIEDKELMLQLSKICRCCLTECSDMQNIFDNENCIPEMIMAIAAIQVGAS